MKGLKITILILSVITLSSQSIHYVYMKYFYDTSSVLDEFVDKEIKSSKNIEYLLVQYKKANVKVKEYEKGKPDKALSKINKYNTEPYKTKNKIKKGIKDWESKQEQHTKLIVQWTLGLLVLIAGLFLYAKNLLWQGMAFISAGIFEMLWWASPSTRLGGAISEFERLLNTKLLLSLVTLIILLTVWWLDKKTD